MGNTDFGAPKGIGFAFLLTDRKLSLSVPVSQLFAKNMPPAYFIYAKTPSVFESLYIKKSVSALMGNTDFGAPKGIRTPDLRFRKPSLYPAELLVLMLI